MESENFEEIVIKKIKNTIDALEDEWFEISLPESHKTVRKMGIYTSVCDLCDKVLANERTTKERILQRIKNNKNQLKILCQELHKDCEIPNDLTPFEANSFLQNKIKELQEEKEKKLMELQELTEKDKLLCNYLEENAYNIPNKDILLSVEELSLLRTHVEEMEAEKQRRINTYKSLRKDIVEFIEQLEKPLEAKILLDVVCNSEPETSLTKSFLLEIRKLHSDLEFEVKELESRSLELREKISSLWNLLQISEETKESFLSMIQSHTPSTISQLENHLSELKELRLKNLGGFIEDLRTELEKWLAKCYVGESQRKEFTKLFSGEISEEVLDTLESEVEKWKNFYNKYSHIFEKVDHFLSLFDNMQQLEKKLKDPTRLFNTRGGALLQEEKERKRVKIELPHVEKQLINLCSEYETVNEKPFLIDGSPIGEYMCKLWNYHSMQKEEEKKNRNQNKNQAMTLTAKVPKKNLNLATPRNCRKRGREIDDNGATVQAKRVLKTPGSGSSNCHRNSPVKGQRAKALTSSSRKVRALRERNHLGIPMAQPLFGGENHHNSLSYDNFKAALKKLNSKEVIHSSLLYHESSDAQSKTKKSEKCISQENDVERKAYLKKTLNLFSPLKNAKPQQSPSTSRRQSILGGASGGAFLIRSSSQPSLKNCPKSPMKLSTKTKCLWLL